MEPSRQNPYLPPVQSRDGPADRAASRRKLWQAYAVWIGALSVLQVGIAAFALRGGGALEYVPRFIGPIVVQSTAPEIATLGAAFAIVTIRNRQAIPTMLGERLLFLAGVFYATPVGAVVAFLLVLVLFASVCTLGGVAPIETISKVIGAIHARHVALGLITVVMRSACCALLMTVAVRVLMWPRWLLVRVVLTFLAAVLATLPVNLASRLVLAKLGWR